MRRRALIAAAMAASVLSGAAPRADGLEPTLRITSPLGRTGLPGTIRIVARLDGLTEPRLTEPKPARLRFFLDNVVLRQISSFLWLRTFWTEIVRQRTLSTWFSPRRYQSGHGPAHSRSYGVINA